MNLAPDDSSGTGRIDRLPDQEIRPWEQAWKAEWERNLMDAALRRVKRRVTIEPYQMFDLFVLKQ